MKESRGPLSPQDEVSPDVLHTKVYSYRWVVLTAFMLVTFSNSFAWFAFSSIAVIAAEHFDVQPDRVDWFVLVYMIAFAVLVFPGSWINSKLGLKKGVAIGAILTALGCIVRVLAAYQRLYWLAVLGQSFAAVGQCLILQVPVSLAAIWFPASQRAIATSLGVLANQLGSAGSFLVSSNMVEQPGDIPVFLIVQAAVATVSSAAFLVFFRAAPPLPPSSAVWKEKDHHRSFFTSLLSLARHRPSVMVALAYGLNVAVFFSLLTRIDPIINEHYPENPTAAGWAGFMFIVPGLLGDLGIGFLAAKVSGHVRF